MEALKTSALIRNPLEQYERRNRKKIPTPLNKFYQPQSTIQVLSCDPITVGNAVENIHISNNTLNCTGGVRWLAYYAGICKMSLFKTCYIIESKLMLFCVFTYFLVLSIVRESYNSPSISVELGANKQKYQLTVIDDRCSATQEIEVGYHTFSAPLAKLRVGKGHQSTFPSQLRPNLR